MMFRFCLPRDTEIELDVKQETVTRNSMVKMTVIDGVKLTLFMTSAEAHELGVLLQAYAVIATPQKSSQV